MERRQESWKKVAMLCFAARSRLADGRNSEYQRDMPGWWRARAKARRTTRAGQPRLGMVNPAD
ncbi:hypothetical protein [Paraburkholderia oxyphila]|uniref:hypothetical protein n=1 Tax=Paraburkholderia oxyphila TaxID=614212 RepID=UPI000AFDC1B7|nr:hypothetical protein [Paraburkholderia oxyphila]